MTPYLPEHAPPPPPPPSAKKSSVKTLLLWIVLIVMFLTVWQFLTPAEKEPAAPPPQCVAPCVEPSGWSSTLVTLIPLAVVITLFVMFIRRLQGGQNLNAEQEPAFRAIAQRRFGEALGIFRTLAAKYEKKPLVRSVIDLGIADTELWAGNLDASILACIGVDQRTTMGIETGVRVVAAADLAFLYALTGDLSAADRWRDEARARLTKTNDGRMATAGKLRLAEAILACRRGAPKDAIALLEEAWLDLRFSFIANWMRVAEVIRAFAEAQGDVREQNVVAGRLVRIEPVIGNELAFLGRKWPEMHAFLAAHGLSHAETKQT